MIMESAISYTQQAIDAIHNSVPLVKHDPSPKPLIDIDLTNNRKPDSGKKYEVATLFRQEMQPLAKSFNEATSREIPSKFITAIDNVIKGVNSLQELITTLNKVTGKFFFRLCKKLFDGSDKLSEDFLIKLAQRIHVIRPKINDIDPIVVLKSTLQFGVYNAAHTAWSLLAIIPTVFFNQEHRLPNFDEYKEIAQSIKPLIRILRTEQEDIFHKLFAILRRKHIITDPSLPSKNPSLDGIEYDNPFHPEDFQIINNKLELTKDTVKATDEKVQQKFIYGLINIFNPRTGCLAGPLIDIITQWCIKAAEATMFKYPKEMHAFCDPMNNRGNFALRANIVTPISYRN